MRPEISISPLAIGGFIPLPLHIPYLIYILPPPSPNSHTFLPYPFLHHTLRNGSGVVSINNKRELQMHITNMSIISMDDAIHIAFDTHIHNGSIEEFQKDIKIVTEMATIIANHQYKLSHMTTKTTIKTANTTNTEIFIKEQTQTATHSVTANM